MNAELNITTHARAPRDGTCRLSVIPTDILQPGNLSPEAQAFLSYALRLPEGQTIHAPRPYMQRLYGWGDRKAQRIVRELKSKGYMSTGMVKGSDGRKLVFFTKFHEIPDREAAAWYNTEGRKPGKGAYIVCTLDEWKQRRKGNTTTLPEVEHPIDIPEEVIGLVSGKASELLNDSHNVYKDGGTTPAPTPIVSFLHPLSESSFSKEKLKEEYPIIPTAEAEGYESFSCSSGKRGRAIDRLPRTPIPSDDPVESSERLRRHEANLRLLEEFEFRERAKARKRRYASLVNDPAWGSVVSAHADVTGLDWNNLLCTRLAEVALDGFRAPPTLRSPAKVREWLATTVEAEAYRRACGLDKWDFREARRACYRMRRGLAPVSHVLTAAWTTAIPFTPETDPEGYHFSRFVSETRYAGNLNRERIVIRREKSGGLEDWSHTVAACSPWSHHLAVLNGDGAQDPNPYIPELALRLLGPGVLTTLGRINRAPAAPAATALFDSGSGWTIPCDAILLPRTDAYGLREYLVRECQDGASLAGILAWACSDNCRVQEGPGIVMGLSASRCDLLPSLLEWTLLNPVPAFLLGLALDGVPQARGTWFRTVLENARRPAAGLLRERIAGATTLQKARWRAELEEGYWAFELEPRVRDSNPSKPSVLEGVAELLLPMLVEAVDQDSPDYRLHYGDFKARNIVHRHAHRLVRHGPRMSEEYVREIVPHVPAFDRLLESLNITPHAAAEPA